MRNAASVAVFALFAAVSAGAAALPGRPFPAAVKAVLLAQTPVVQFVALDALSMDLGGLGSAGLPVESRALAPAVEAHVQTLAGLAEGDESSRARAAMALTRLELVMSSRIEDKAQLAALREARKQSLKDLTTDTRRFLEANMQSFARALGLPDDPGALEIDPASSVRRSPDLQAERRPQSRPAAAAPNGDAGGGLMAERLRSYAGSRQDYLRVELKAQRAARSEISRSAWNVLSASRDRRGSIESILTGVRANADEESNRLAALTWEQVLVLNGPEDRISAFAEARAVARRIEAIASRLARESDGVEDFRRKLRELAEHVRGWAADKHAAHPVFSNGGLFWH